MKEFRPLAGFWFLKVKACAESCVVLSNSVPLRGSGS